jgi:NADH-quinone oxidoreductase subunit L
MSEALPGILWLIPALPLLASAVTALLGPRLLRHRSHWPCVVAVVASCALSLFVFSNVYRAEPPELPPLTVIEKDEETGKLIKVSYERERPGYVQAVVEYYTWFADRPSSDQAREPIPESAPGSPIVRIAFSLRADALSSMMLVMITFIGSLIVIYSIGYMHHDPGYPRFFAAMALFIFSMTTLVLADNFFVLYLGWEGVGLCSYLLIGFWFQRPSAALAARKAFLVTRIGDVGLFLGILLLWVTFDYNLDYTTIFQRVEAGEQIGPVDPYTLWAACLLLFCGAVGKSAQFPLHVWLPDAMEGPTPVSALIHAATMVTAGVYLVARCTPLFLVVPEAQLMVACIGGLTALLAALIALTQNDLKRILAYSTLSQLGYMFLALGCGIAAGGEDLVTFAVVAALFHLFTHAFFKALLFLAAGSVMHAMGDVIDIRRFSGLRKVLPVTHWTFLCGALALAGFPLLSGFWSKDEILDAAWRASRAKGGQYAWVYSVLLVSGIVTAGLTAFYTFRAYFKTFHGPEVIPEEAHGHAHESPPVMTVPLMILAVFAVGVGFVLGPLGPKALQFAHFLEKAPGFPPVTHEHHINWGLMGISTLVALGGMAVAYWMYAKQPGLPGKVASEVPALYQLSLNKFYIDELYAAFIVAPLNGVKVFAGALDLHFIDGLVDLIGNVPAQIGKLFRPVQNGLVQFYALAMVLGLTVFLLSLLRSL